ncbi:MAG: N-acetyl-gamma-glutamyl-phosphate reductase, partial [uncultured Acidimicrobiales bacterium]
GSGRGRRSVGLCGSRAPPPVPLPSRPGCGVGDGRHPGGDTSRRALSEPGRRLPRTGVRAVRSRAGDRRRTGLPGPPPRGVAAAHACPARRRGEGRRPGGRLPAARPGRVRALVRRGARGTGPARPVRLRAPRTPSGPHRQGRRRGVRRVLPHGGRPGPGAADGGRCNRDHGHHRGRGERRLRRRPGPQARHPLRDRQPGLHRLRPARPPPHAGDGAVGRRIPPVHPAPRAHDPGHPGHLLRPPGARHHAVDGGDPGPAGRRLRRRAVRGGVGRQPLDQGHLGIERRAPLGPLRRAHRMDPRPGRPGQPGQGGVGAGGAVRQPPPGPRRDCRPFLDRGVSV